MNHRIKDLKIWIMAKQIAVDVYLLTSNFPSDEKFGLTNQMRRCSVSVASNIAEGSGRNSNGEFKQFLGIARGSLYELETQLIISQEVGLITELNCNDLLLKIDELNKMIFSFKEKLITKSNI